MPPSPDSPADATEDAVDDVSADSTADGAPVDLSALPALSALRSELDVLVEAFTSGGFRLYLVGGIVRDLIHGESGGSSDVDLTTDAEPEDIKRLIRPLADAVWIQGERFGTIGAHIPRPAGGVREVEITTHRAERYSPDSRKPEVAFGTDLRQDLARRDFTVNAMSVELVGGVGGDDPTRATTALRDPFDGVGDLAARVLRTPLSPEVSFDDDPLRMMRAARFMSRFDLEPRPELESAAAAMADRLAIVSVERVAVELERLLAVDNPVRGLEFLDRTGLLAQILGVPFDAGAAVTLGSTPAPPHIRRAGLLSSVENPSAVLARLRYSTDDQRSTAGLVEALRGWLASGRDLEATRRAVDAVTRAKSSHDDLAALAVAWATVEVEPEAAGIVAPVNELVDADDLGPYISPLTGPEIMETLGAEPGPIIGRAKKVLVEKRLRDGPFDADTARRVLAEHRHLLDSEPGPSASPSR